MNAIRTPSAMHKTMLGAAIAAATLGLVATANAEQIHWPWQQKRPVHRHVPAVKRAIPADAMATTRTMETPPTDSYSATSQPYQPSNSDASPSSAQYYQSAQQQDSYPSMRSSAPDPYPAIKVSPPVLTSSRSYGPNSSTPTQNAIPAAPAAAGQRPGAAAAIPQAPTPAAAPERPAATAAIEPTSDNDQAFTPPESAAAASNAQASAAVPVPAPQPAPPRALVPAP